MTPEQQAAEHPDLAERQTRMSRVINGAAEAPRTRKRRSDADKPRPVKPVDLTTGLSEHDAKHLGALMDLVIAAEVAGVLQAEVRSACDAFIEGLRKR